MLATLLIVFREVIEAGLIVGIVLAASRDVPRRTCWVGCGVAFGGVGACVVAALAGQLAALFAGSGQELFNAGILIVAVGMLTWHNVWMASHGRAMAREMCSLGADVAAGKRPLVALSLVVGIAVLREGSEVVLFLYGIAASGGSSMLAMLGGGILGLFGGVVVSALMYFGLLTIPPGRLFVATSGLITMLAAGLAAQAIAFLQQAGDAAMWTAPVWDSSWLLSDDSIPGRLLHTLIGYTDQPSGAQLSAYIATILLIAGLMRLVGGRQTAPASAVGD